jgi:hypothetical protein
MKNIEFKQNVDIAALDSQLRAALGDLVIGLSSYGADLTVHLADEATKQDEETATEVVTSHVTAEAKIADSRGDELTLESLARRVEALEARFQ